MNLFAGENRPDVCASIGLDCRTCVQKAAASVARVCQGLSTAGTQEIFFQLFPSTGCAAMAPAFEAVYLENIQVLAAERLVRAVAAAA